MCSVKVMLGLFVYLFKEHHGASFDLILLHHSSAGRHGKLNIRHVQEDPGEHFDLLALQTLEKREREIPLNRGR